MFFSEEFKSNAYAQHQLKEIIGQSWETKHTFVILLTPSNNDLAAADATFVRNLRGWCSIFSYISDVSLL